MIACALPPTATKRDPSPPRDPDELLEEDGDGAEKDREEKTAGPVDVTALSAPEAEPHVSMLMHKGAELKLTDDDGWNALHWAAHHGRTSAAAKVLEMAWAQVAAGRASGSVVTALAAKDSQGRTAEMLAEAGGNASTAQVLKEGKDKATAPLAAN